MSNCTISVCGAASVTQESHTWMTRMQIWYSRILRVTHFPLSIWPGQGCLHAEGPILEFHLSPVPYMAIVWPLAIVGKWKWGRYPSEFSWWVEGLGFVTRVWVLSLVFGFCHSCLGFLQVIFLVSGLASHWGRGRLHPRFFAWAMQAPRHVGKVKFVWYFGDFKSMFRSYFGHPWACA